MHHFVYCILLLLIFNAKIPQSEATFPLLPTQSEEDDSENVECELNVHEEYQKIQRQISGAKTNSANDDSCVGRCGERKSRYGELLKCYCDGACLYLGDCCADYLERCNADVDNNSSAYEAYKCIQPMGNVEHGVAMVAKCPISGTMEKSCGGSEKMTQLLPVLGDDDKVYKNVFCAACNGVRNWTFWNADAADCSNISALISDEVFWNVSSLVREVRKLCWWRFSPSTDQSAFVQKCVPNFFNACEKLPFASELGYKYQKLCGLYSSVVCSIEGNIYKNPHCALCERPQLNDVLTRDCTSEHFAIRTAPTLSIMFRFQKRETKIVCDEKEVRFTKACDETEIYDPFDHACKVFYYKTETVNVQADGPENLSDDEVRNYTALKSAVPLVNLTTPRKPCKSILLREQEYTILKNASVFVKYQGRLYPKTSYQKETNGILLCTDFSRRRLNVSQLRAATKKRRRRWNAEELITVTGSLISIGSLLFLVVTFSIFEELRTLPGKATLNLSCALVLAYSLFLFTGQVTPVPLLCHAYAVLLHYLWLASFFWMSIIGHDIARTFGSKVMTTRTSTNVAMMQTRNQFKKYALFGWGFPLFLVVTSVVLDLSNLVTIGYGNSQYCWITNQAALVLVFEIPVAVVLGYNAYALIVTLLALRRHQNTATVSHVARAPRKLTICMKLTTVMGLTWALGLGTTLTDSGFLVYPYLVLNSLQGSFIAVAFAMNQRVIRMYKTLALSRARKRSVSRMSTGLLFIKKRGTMDVAQTTDKTPQAVLATLTFQK